jgi:hypothetical protein
MDIAPVIRLASGSVLDWPPLDNSKTGVQVKLHEIQRWIVSENRLKFQIPKPGSLAEPSAVSGECTAWGV